MSYGDTREYHLPTPAKWYSCLFIRHCKCFDSLLKKDYGFLSFFSRLFQLLSELLCAYFELKSSTEKAAVEKKYP